MVIVWGTTGEVDCEGGDDGAISGDGKGRNGISKEDK